MKCDIEDQYRSLNWRYQWYKHTNEVLNFENYTVNRDSLTINGVTESDQDEFSCRAEIHGRPQISHSSSAVNLTVKALPKVTVSVTSERSVFTGETVTMKCEIEDQYRSLNWTYLWYKDTNGTSVFEGNIYTIRSPSDQDEFWCRGEKDGQPSSSQYSDHVTLSVKGVFQEAMSGFKIFTYLLAVCPYLLATVVLFFKCCRLRVSHSSLEDQLQYAVREDETSI
ncbi:uncharacterized protein [Paramisgurnus dabryanus]|uniref:uncharacterized protein n=1 Tax=Paramisgurnus dabryanus TaxID=90735 RepID=UPI0031F3BBA7